MKDVLRRQLLEARSALSMEARRRQERAVADRLRHLPAVRAASVILGYHPLGSELDVLECLAERVREGKTVALPRVVERGLDLHAWNPGEPLEVSPLKVMEPLAGAPRVRAAEVGVVVVPGVGFDRLGHRLGHGRGFYDRLLGAVPRDRRVGVAFDVQVLDALPTEAHDVPLGWLVTERETLRFP